MANAFPFDTVYQGIIKSHKNKISVIFLIEGDEWQNIKPSPKPTKYAQLKPFAKVRQIFCLS